MTPDPDLADLLGVLPPDLVALVDGCAAGWSSEREPLLRALAALLARCEAAEARAAEEAKRASTFEHLARLHEFLGDGMIDDLAAIEPARENESSVGAVKRRLDAAEADSARLRERERALEAGLREARTQAFLTGWVRGYHRRDPDGQEEPGHDAEACSRAAEADLALYRANVADAQPPAAPVDTGEHETP
jgi:hypothetical protein